MLYLRNQIWPPRDPYRSGRRRLQFKHGEEPAQKPPTGTLFDIGLGSRLGVLDYIRGLGDSFWAIYDRFSVSLDPKLAVTAAKYCATCGVSNINTARLAKVSAETAIIDWWAVPQQH